ncbi:hypothetical protein ABZP36_026398 [Zizania latifolia]
MATKLDQSPQAKPTASPSLTPKISIFGAKAGFLIPKNKLPGSLVARSNAKNEAPAAAASKEDNAKHVQRITKWGPDLTLDPSVRKSRALAYQTRLVQITKELKSGALETRENEGSISTARDSNSDDANNPKKNEQGKVELLELERREIIGQIIFPFHLLHCIHSLHLFIGILVLHLFLIVCINDYCISSIGEILHLNSGYKVPEDYKPLLKETKIPLLTKAHQEHNIIGVLMGLDSNARKRLQQETGAKICVYGTKKTNGEKTEIHQPDINEAQDAYEDLYINVSADSYDKLDAAITLIELLLTPASVNSTATEASATVSSEVSSGGADLADLQQVQSNTCQPGFLQYQSHNAHWVSTPQANVPSIPSSGSLPSTLPNNTFQFQPPTDSLSMPPYTVPPHVMNIMPRNPLPIHGPQPSMPNPQQPPPQFQANPSIGPPFGRPPGIVSPLLAPSSMLPRSIRPLQTPHASGGWLNFSSVPVQPQRPSPTFMPVRPPISVSPLVSTPQLEGVVPPVPSQSNMSTSYGTQHPLGARFATSATLPSRPGGPQSFPSVLPQGPSSVPMLSSPAGLPPQSYPMSMQMRPPMPTPTQMRGPASAFPQVPPAGFGMAGSASISYNQTSMGGLRPPRPATGDFTFRPLVSSCSPTPVLGASASQMGFGRPANQRPMAPGQGFQRPIQPHLARNPAAALQSPTGFRVAFPPAAMSNPFHMLPPPPPPPPQQQKPFLETGGSRPGGANPIYDPFAVSGEGKAADLDPEYEDLMASVGVK